MTDSLPFDYNDSPASPAAPKPKCRRHTRPVCERCGHVTEATASRRSRNNRKRGVSDELSVARILGGRKVGQLNLPWDVDVEGFMRVQAKKYASWPSVNDVIGWLDAIPAGRELRAVALADCPGGGTRTRRLLIVDLYEFAAWFAAEGETAE